MENSIRLNSEGLYIFQIHKRDRGAHFKEATTSNKQESNNTVSSLLVKNEPLPRGREHRSKGRLNQFILRFSWPYLDGIA